MAPAIGPYDGRKSHKKRCHRCIERRIKCIGGRPCLNCTKTNHVCEITTLRKDHAPIFVHATQTSFSQRGHSHVGEVTIRVPAQGPSIRADFYVNYFFTSFLHQNAFTGITSQFGTALSSLLHHSPELHAAVSAISALHITQHGQSTFSHDDKLAALQAYSQSVQHVRERIASQSFIRDPSSLWTTLLLGVFELMWDNTGAHWLSHFLNGTSTLLRLQGPSLLEPQDDGTIQRQVFFFSIRVFEISRALIYTEPTFLATPGWSKAIDTYWAQHPASWTPKEALFDILPQFVDLAIRALDFVGNSQTAQCREQYQQATSLAQEGLSLRSALLHWKSNSLLPSCLTGQDNQPETLIARVYYHTISIYLDGIFSYHTPFTAKHAPISPTLDCSAIDTHVASILDLSQELLAQGTAGILLFFPLRVAGARAKDCSSQTEILGLLHAIVQRGFVVASSFVADLSGLWARKVLEQSEIAVPSGL